MLYVKDLPKSEQPVNRLREAGPSALSTAEVLAAIIQTPNALDQAYELLTRFGNLRGLELASEVELAEIDGIGPAAAARIRAAVEFGRRMMLFTPDDKPSIRSPADIANILLPEMRNLEQENFKVLLLDARNRVMANITLYIGTVDSARIRAAEVFKAAIRANAVSIIVAHNHPSGDPTPSPEDVALTCNLKKLGDELEIELLDHIIVGGERTISLKERGLGF